MKKKVLDEGLGPSVLLVGLGRLGGHLRKHLERCFLGPISLCSKSENLKALIKSNNIEYIFLAVPDLVIEAYIEQIPRDIKIVHFSGSYYNKKALGVHPVQSFSEEGTYDFSSINFVVDGKLDETLKKVFRNTHHINPEHKKMYHTYISIAANSIQLLVNRLGKTFSEETEMPEGLLKEIVLQSLQRERAFGERSFSGPWTRGEGDLQKEQVEISNDKNLKDLNSLFENLIRRYSDECAKV